MQIYILLTNNCNLSCSHCIRTDKSNTTLSKQEKVIQLYQNKNWIFYLLMLISQIIKLY